MVALCVLGYVGEGLNSALWGPETIRMTPGGLHGVMAYTWPSDTSIRQILDCYPRSPAMSVSPAHHAVHQSLSSADVRLVKSFVNFIEKAFVGHNRPQIRCTSLPGYELALGDSPKEKPAARNQKIACDLFAYAAQSAEPMGVVRVGCPRGDCRAGSSRCCIKYVRISSPAALNGDVAGNLLLRGDVLRVVDQINKELGWLKEGASRIDDALNRSDAGGGPCVADRARAGASAQACSGGASF